MEWTRLYEEETAVLGRRFPTLDVESNQPGSHRNHVRRKRVLSLRGTAISTVLSLDTAALSASFGSNAEYRDGDLRV